MGIRNLALTPQAESIIEAGLRSGRFHDAEEVVGEALQLFQAREREYEQKLQAIREAVQLGIDDIENGRFVTLRSPEEVIAHVRQATSAPR